MKRRHDSTVDSFVRPQPEGTENAPRGIFKKRRTLNDDNWVGLGKRRSLRDINNLSEHPASIPHDEKTTLKVTQNKTHRGSPISPLKEIVPTPNISSSELNTPLDGSRSEHPPTSTNSRLLPASVPDQQKSILGLTSSPHPGVSEPAVSPSIPRFVPHDKPVRITYRQTHPSDRHTSLGSDQEDESSDGDEESEDEGVPGPEEVDNDEKQCVESNYSEINKLLGNLFLSRHRNRT